MKKFLSQFKDRKHLFSFLLSYPFWLLTAPDKRKPYNEFITGLLPHVCTFSSKPYSMDARKFDRSYFYACTHKGCNTLNVENYLTERGIQLYRKIHRLHPEFYNDKFIAFYKNAEACNPKYMELLDRMERIIKYKI